MITAPKTAGTYRRRWAGLIGFLTVLTLATAVHADSAWRCRIWQSDDGLPNNNVISLAQTSDGYLWTATSSRLARFDGIRFETFSSHQVVPGLVQKISALLQSRDGGLIIAMDYGPVLRLQAGRSELLADDLPPLLARALTEDAAGGLWITYHDGTTCRISKERVQQFTTSDGLPTGSVCSLALDTDGRLWFAKGGDVGLFVDGRFSRELSVGNMKTRIAAARSEGIWIASGYELHHYTHRGKLIDLGQFARERPGEGATCLLEDRLGAVWIGTSDSGLFRFRDGAFEAIATSHSQIVTLLEDADGNVWAGTGGGGLNCVEQRIIRLEDGNSGLPYETVRSLCEDANGSLWLATQNGLLACRTNGQWQVLSGTDRWPAGGVTCVITDSQGALWVGTRNRALHRWHNGELTTWRNSDGLNGRTVHSLLVSRTGDLWISTDGPAELQRLRHETIETIRTPHDGARINSMVQDAAGVIWASTSRGGLLRIAGDEISDETASTVGAPKSIRSLHATPDGSLWIGYAGAGVGWLKNGQFYRIRGDQGLYDAYISQIASDERGWLWFGSDRGIFRVRQTDLEEVALRRSPRVRSIPHGRTDGLPSLQANFGISPSTLRDRAGNLWMPMRTALAIVYPDRVRSELPSPTVLLKRVALDEKPIALHGGILPVTGAVDLLRPSPIRLPPRHRRIAFEFTAPIVSAAENVEFRYRLKGLEDDWSQGSAQRNASYSRLPSGTYRFEVQARNGESAWSGDIASLNFSVVPFLWQTWWFRLGTLGGFTLTIFLAARYASVRRLRIKLAEAERQSALERERTRIARDLHDDLGSRLTSIVLLSETALQQGTVARSEMGTETVQKISTAAREVVRSLDETVWAVNPRNDNLPHLLNYIGQFAAGFLKTAGIRCRVDLLENPPAHPLSAEARHNLYLAVKEALHNVVRHAHATEVRLRVSSDENGFTLSVEDNGRGLEHTTDDPDADGLRNMKQRMNAVGGKVEIQSRPGEGTMVRFSIRWHRL